VCKREKNEMCVMQLLAGQLNMSLSMVVVLQLCAVQQQESLVQRLQVGMNCKGNSLLSQTALLASCCCLVIVRGSSSHGNASRVGFGWAGHCPAWLATRLAWALGLALSGGPPTL
jgi:hypothetical protein